MAKNSLRKIASIFTRLQSNVRPLDHRIYVLSVGQTLERQTRFLGRLLNDRPVCRTSFLPSFVPSLPCLIDRC